MKMHLYQFEQLLFLANNIKAVAEHIATAHERDNYHIKQLPDDSLIEVKSKVMDLVELTQQYQTKARQNGYSITDELSIFIQHGKVILIDTILSPKNHQEITFFEPPVNQDLSIA